MLVNSNYRYGGGGIGSSLIIEGYYNNSKFYEDDLFTTEITGESGKIYVDLSTNKTYRWNGSIFTVIADNADTVDGLHASDFMPINGEVRKYGLIRMNGSDGIRVRHIDGNDTEADGALYLNWNSPNAPIYMNGGNTAIHSGNIGSQSVNYANSAGNANTVEGFRASRFIQWIGQQADTTIISDPNYKIDYHCGIGNGAMIGLPVSAWYHIIYYQHLNSDGYGMQIAYPLNHAGDIMTRRSNGFTWTEWKAILTSSGGTMTGALVAQSNTAYSTPQVRNVTMSTSAPSGGSNGQIHYQYS